MTTIGSEKSCASCMSGDGSKGHAAGVATVGATPFAQMREAAACRRTRRRGRSRRRPQVAPRPIVRIIFETGMGEASHPFRRNIEERRFLMMRQALVALGPKSVVAGVLVGGAALALGAIFIPHAAASSNPGMYRLVLHAPEESGAFYL